MKSKIIFIFIVISVLVISGCWGNDVVLNSKMKCSDGRIVSIGEGCGFNYDFHLTYEMRGSWSIYHFVEISGDGGYIVKENDELSNNFLTREGKLQEYQIKNLMSLVDD